MAHGGKQMGVNCSVTLNPKAEWRYVGLVASILLGDKPYKDNFSSGWSAKSKKYGYGKTRSAHDPSYCYILAQGDPDNPAAKLIQESDGELPYEIWYGLERKSLYPKATAAKIALAEGICKFFGGTIVYNDATDAKRTFPCPGYIGAEDGKAWYRLQQAILDLKPLTTKDIERNQKHAAY
jgi:hypothetical protein